MQSTAKGASLVYPFEMSSMGMSAPGTFLKGPPAEWGEAFLPAVRNR